MNFNRWSKPEGASWAYWQFNEYETHLNHMYWAGEALTGFSLFNVRNAEPGSDVGQVLCASGPNAHRFSRKKDEFISHSEDLQTWIRASFVMAATGALESYITRVVLTALMSDPAVFYGKPKAIDGLAWLKLGISVDHSDYMKSVTTNTWSARYSALKKVFGDIPSVYSKIADLDRIRIYRNGVGHAFGRNITDEINLLTRDVDGLNGISEKTFIHWLSVISSAAKSIDKHLVSNHIGEFEMLMHFHEYLNSHDRAASNIKLFTKFYKRALAKDIGHSRSINYLQEMMSHYDSV